jgi:hypothetical protein
MNWKIQCVRDYLFAPKSGYACSDWREMKTLAHFLFINESPLVRLPLQIALRDDDSVEIMERSGGVTHTLRVANPVELLRFLAAHVPTGGRLAEHRHAARVAIEERDKLEAVRFARVKAAEECVQPEDVSRLVATVSDSMRNNLDVITVTGRASLMRKTLYMVQLALEAALPAPTEY